MSKSTHSTKQISELEQHTAQLRARVDDTLGELGEQLTPSRLGRKAAGAVGTKLLRGSAKLARSASRRPQPLLAVAIGLLTAWCVRRMLRR